LSASSGPAIPALPTPAQLDLGGYETRLGTNRVEREASVMITEKILELFGRVR
jgi:hypothetical protein